jgi:hypothetical protein
MKSPKIKAGIAAIFAPEGAEIEIPAGEFGASLIEFGGYVSTAGSTLTAYANRGAKGALNALFWNGLIGKINERATGLGSSVGVSETNIQAVQGLLDQAPDGILEEEAACNVN